MKMTSTKVPVMKIPVLETERLILRDWREGDFETCAEFMTDPDVMRFLGGVPQSRADAWRGVAVWIGHWILRGYGFWAVERKEDGAFIGRIGLWNPEGWPGMEVGWTLGRPYWGKGYATEAGRASMDYAFENFPIAKLLSVIHPDNTQSQVVAARLGETRGPRQEVSFGGRTFPADIWSITRARWAELRPR